MAVFAVCLLAAALVGAATRGGPQAFGRVRGLPLVFVAVALEVLPLKLGMASAVARVGTTAGFAVLLVAALLNWGKPGIALAAVGIALNFAVIAANEGRMPINTAAAARSGVAVEGTTAGPARHEPEDAATRLAPLDDRIPVTPLGQVISVGDVLLALGMSHALLAGMGSRLVSRTPAPVPAGARGYGEGR